MTTEAKSDKPLMLRNVRVSYPHVFKKAVWEGEPTKFEATFIIPKNDPQLKTIKERIGTLRKALPFKVVNDKICLRDGDQLDKDEYKGCCIIKASTNRRPQVINRDKTPITEDDNIIYGGCYVNATVDFWSQNNKFGKRINANLRAIQFVKDGEAFGSGPVDDEAEFEELEDSVDNADGFGDDDEWDDIPF